MLVLGDDGGEDATTEARRGVSVYFLSLLLTVSEVKRRSEVDDEKQRADSGDKVKPSLQPVATTTDVLRALIGDDVV